MLTPLFAMNQVCQVYRWVERGVSEEVYAEPEAVRCRACVGTKAARQRAQTGYEAAVPSGMIYVPAGLRLSTSDKVAVDGVRYAVMSCEPFRDLAGRECYVRIALGG